MNTPDFFVGARLGAARVKAGIALEKAAKDTRIRVQRLKEIEADDFSGFTHPTYSRLFLLDYAEYLGVPLDEVRPLLPDRTGSAGGGFQYIDALSRQPSSPVVPMRPRKRKILRWVVGAGVILLLAAAGLFTYFTLQKLERVARSAPLSGSVEESTASALPSPSPTASIEADSLTEPVPPQTDQSLPPAPEAASTPNL